MLLQKALAYSTFLLYISKWEFLMKRSLAGLFWNDFLNKIFGSTRRSYVIVLFLVY